MNVVHLISKKRDGGELSPYEIGALVEGYVHGSVPDYQMAAWTMAVFLRGMTVEETAALTEHMLYSGVTFEWPDGEAPKVDKHSTGGIGDKVSLVLAPLLACCDLQVPMISGRGLGATGGTVLAAYLVQALAVGLVGSLAGAAAGALTRDDLLALLA